MENQFLRAKANHCKNLTHASLYSNIPYNTNRVTSAAKRWKTKHFCFFMQVVPFHLKFESNDMLRKFCHSYSEVQSLNTTKTNTCNIIEKKEKRSKWLMWNPRVPQFLDKIWRKNCIGGDLNQLKYFWSNKNNFILLKFGF